MKIKTSELDGAALDWAVAKCEGKDGVLHDDGITRCIVIAAPSGVYKGTWRPSLNWSQAGPIIEREGICLYSMDAVAPWDARLYDGESEPWHAVGDTPLVAAMRCYVASKLGDTVDIPEELV